MRGLQETFKIIAGLCPRLLLIAKFTSRRCRFSIPCTTLACLPSRKYQQVFLFLTRDVGGLKIKISFFSKKQNTWVVNMASFRSSQLGYTIANRVSKETSVLATGVFFSLQSQDVREIAIIYHTADKQLCQTSIYESFSRWEKDAMNGWSYFVIVF